MKKGLFVTIEGGEGSGKSTQAALLVRALRRQGRAVVQTREPGGTALTEGIRNVLLHPDSRVSPLAELLLYEAARAQHVGEMVRPALRQGAVVVCDRFTDSTLAYQGYGRGLPLEAIERLNRIATEGLRPQLTFLLDVPAEAGLRRARALAKKITERSRQIRGDRLERASLAFHRRVRRGFLALARRDRRRIRVIPWREGIDVVHAQILAEMEKWL